MYCCRKGMSLVPSQLWIFYGLVALFLAYALAGMLIGPFNAITGKNIVLSFTPELIAISILTVLATGILAGSYPAFYLSHFRPIQVLKGDIKSTIGEIWARKGLVIFQFAITIMLIVGVVVIHRQTQYVNTKHLGYDRDNVIFFGQNGGIAAQRDAFFNELRNIPGVIQVGSTNHSLLGQESSNPGLSWEGKAPEERILFERFYVDQEFYETMGFQMAEGRWFRREFASDSTKLIINETAAKAMGFSLEEAIGQRVALWEGFEFDIIGVVKDFHYVSLHEPVQPAYFRMAGTGNIVARLEAGREVEALAEIEALYHQFAPGYIFDYTFMDNSYQALYASEKRVGTLSSIFASFAIIISCLGIFGLAAFTAERRIKEIGIRKVLGASTSNIVMMLSRDFIYLVFASMLIALPVAYYFMREWLTQFAYKIDLSIWIFLGASLVALVIAGLTVSSQALRAASVNPAKCLKDE
ncbi:MAG: FtsX-like permease family protein, partial [Bacteroidota bacterium]